MSDPTPLPSDPRGPLKAFVRSAWILLAFQLVAAALAVAVTGWATLQVRPLLAERERLTKQIGQAETRVAELAVAQETARLEVTSLQQRAARLRADLQGARDATPVLTAAIRAFHAKNYALAIVKYDEALRLDPGDAYIHNLKSYSQFKAQDYQGAIQTLSRALELDPTYDWGYFDLARYQCAAKLPQEALATISEALAQRGESVRKGLAFFLSEDGEFRSLCRDIRSELTALSQYEG